MKSSIINTLGVSLVLIFVAGIAQANIEVSCVAEDCLAEGWQAYDMRTGDSSISICATNDCKMNGWQSNYKGRLTGEVVCKERGCFSQGWVAYDGNRRMTADVTCQNSFAGSNCLQYGWTTYEPGRGSYLTRCVNGDCENEGWDVIVNGFVPQSVRCKEGGCFTIGWIVYQ